MSDHERTWERVHAALDSRRDPVGDTEVRRAAEKDARFAAELERLRTRLTLLGARPMRRTGPRVAAGVLALCLAGAGGWSWRSLAPTSDPRADVQVRASGELVSSSPAATQAGSAGAVLSFHARAETYTPTTRMSVVSDGVRNVTCVARSQRDAPESVLLATVTWSQP